MPKTVQQILSPPNLQPMPQIRTRARSSGLGGRDEVHNVPRMAPASAACKELQVPRPVLATPKLNSSSAQNHVARLQIRNVGDIGEHLGSTSQTSEADSPSSGRLADSEYLRLSPASQRTCLKPRMQRGLN